MKLRRVEETITGILALTKFYSPETMSCKQEKIIRSSIHECPPGFPLENI